MRAVHSLILDLFQLAKVGDWESDEVMWKVDRFFKEVEGKEEVTLGGLFIICKRQAPGEHTFWCAKSPS